MSDLKERIGILLMSVEGSKMYCCDKDYLEKTDKMLRREAINKFFRRKTDYTYPEPCGTCHGCLPLAALENVLNNNPDEQTVALLEEAFL